MSKKKLETTTEAKSDGTRPGELKNDELDKLQAGGTTSTRQPRGSLFSDENIKFTGSARPQDQ